MSHHAKAIVAFFTSLGTWGATALAVGEAGEPAAVTGVEWFGLCGVIVATVAVWATPNSDA